VSKLRLAFFSPWSPQRSGIADYSEELLPHLAELAELTLVAGSPPSEWLRRRYRVIGIEEFLRSRSSFDLPIYQVGNSVEHHGYMIECARSAPGLLVLHDYCLQYLMLGLTLMRGNFRALEWALRFRYGAQAGHLARQLLCSAVDPFTLSLAGPLIACSKAVVVHSQYAEQNVCRDFPDTPTRHIPMGVSLDLLAESRADLRRRHGFSETEFVVASINSPAYHKRLDLLLQGVRVLRRQHPHTKLVILGGAHFGAKTRGLLEDPGLAGAVLVPGWTSPQVYREFIALADVVVDVRYPSGGETSASLMRALAAGKALVVSAQGTFLELPDSCAIKVPVRDGEEKELAETLATLSENPDRVAGMGQASREYAVTELNLEVAARRYHEFAQEVARLPEPVLEKVGPPGETPAPGRPLVAAAYGVFRAAAFVRQYGLTDTVARVRREIQARRSSAGKKASQPGTED